MEDLHDNPEIQGLRSSGFRKNVKLEITKYPRAK
jgi:hypothetical protein